MAQPKTLRPDNQTPYKLGDEEATALVLKLIDQQISGTDDRILHRITFDFGMKTLALTLQGIILGCPRVNAFVHQNSPVGPGTYRAGSAADADQTGHRPVRPVHTGDISGTGVVRRGRDSHQSGNRRQ